MKVANKNCRTFVENMQEFKGSNLEGKFNSNGNYVVLSYGWYPVFINMGNKWFEVVDRYSSSTARQMYHSRPNDTIKVSKETMRDLMFNR